MYDLGYIKMSMVPSLILNSKKRLVKTPPKKQTTPPKNKQTQTHLKNHLKLPFLFSKYDFRIKHLVVRLH